MTGDTRDDTVLWNAFKAGDQQALAGLYSLYAARLFNYGCKFTPNTALVEDAVQDLFVRLWHKRATTGTPASVNNYLYRALRNTVLRSLQNDLRLETSPLSETSYDFSIELSAESFLIKKESEMLVTQQLANAIRSVLTSRQREAIYLRFQENLAYEEIADILDISVKATYKIVGRALTALRAAMGTPVPAQKK